MSKKKIILFVAGFALVIVGVTLCIKNWIFIQMLFRGVLGPVLAVAGMVVLCIARD